MAGKDDLGDRMKEHYENRTRILLPRRTYTLLRVDGKKFHTYTKNCKRPFDEGLMEDMDLTAKALCEQIEGAKLAFVQSDEISVLLTDFATPQTEAFFDGNLQKICSVSASIATAAFNQARATREAGELLTVLDNIRTEEEQPIGIKAKLLGSFSKRRLAHFDSRVWTIPEQIEVYNYFLWRQQDASRNSISMTAQAHFSPKELQGKSSSQMQEMLFTEKGINWNDMPVGFKRGRVIERIAVEKDVVYIDKRTGETKTESNVRRSEWVVSEPPVFSMDKEWLLSRIPEH